MTTPPSSDNFVKDISFIKDIQAMAVIGSSKKRNFFFLRNHQENFKGKLYAVHHNVKEIPDFPKENIFPSVKEIPGKVDFAFIERLNPIKYHYLKYFTSLSQGQ